jgi:protein gp37
MGDHSAIEWTDASWNPVTGCSHVSPGCAHCYAETLSLRLGFSKKPWTARNAVENVVLHPDRLDQPLRWRRPRRVFVNSMSDLFHELIPDEFIDRVFGVMAKAWWHTYQVLTKRPERMQEYLTGHAAGGRHIWLAAQEYPWPAWAMDAVNRGQDRGGWPLPQAWLGVSVEDQPRADERIPFLLQTPAAVRFLSCEPLLGPIRLDDPMIDRPSYFYRYENVNGPRDIHWVIVGGESGPGARPMDVAWVRSIVAQCKAADVPVFVKQLGARAISPVPAEQHPSMRFVENTFRYEHWMKTYGGVPMLLRDRKGGDPSEWPEDLRIREWPTAHAGVA